LEFSAKVVGDDKGNPIDASYALGNLFIRTPDLAKY
jgi:hypothetical protein